MMRVFETRVVYRSPEAAIKALGAVVAQRQELLGAEHILNCSAIAGREQVACLPQVRPGKERLDGLPLKANAGGVNRFLIVVALAVLTSRDVILVAIDSHVRKADRCPARANAGWRQIARIRGGMK